MSETVKISVRNLVEFILREGDIDQRRTQERIKSRCSLGQGSTEDPKTDGIGLPCRSTFEDGSFVRRIHTLSRRKGRWNY